ncbi:MAG: acyloxyacyl hydrolase [Rhodocyclales bacterium]|nr:acyloxyacyl hydrolase [Rhodocyclales bacterium]
MKRLVPALVAACLSLPAFAQDKNSMTAFYGQDGDIDRYGLSYRFKPFWGDVWNGWQATLSPEVEASYLEYDGKHPGNDNAGELGALVRFRLERGMGAVRPYLDLGLGGAGFTDTHLGDKDLGSAFQFTEHVGFGLSIDQTWSIGYRYTHYSNAGIADENDGLDLHNVVLEVKF